MLQANNTASTNDSSEDAAAERQVEAELAIARDGAATAMSNYSQKLIEQKEKELRESIHKNYSRMKDVERELSNLQLQLKLTNGPKKHALELMRRKIEAQTERVVAVRSRYDVAKQVFQKLEEQLKTEEGEKDRLCDELNTLVMQSAQLQLNKLDELRLQLETMYGGMGMAQAPPQQLTVAAADAASTVPSGANGATAGPASVPAAAQQADAEAAKAKAEAEAAAAAAAEAERQQRQAEAKAARSRHVGIGSSRNTKPPSDCGGLQPEAVAVPAGTSSQGRVVEPRKAAPRGPPPSRGAPRGVPSGAPQQFAGFDDASRDDDD